MTTSEVRSPRSRRRLRWFQISFRSLLLVVVAICLWLGFRVDRARKQEEIVRRITANERNGVTYAHEISADAKFVPNATPPAPAWLRKITGEQFFLQPRMVTLIEYDDAIFSKALELRCIEIMNLAEANDVQLQQLRNVPSLRMLDASSPSITRAGLAHLARLKNLEHISVRSAWITDEDLKILLPLKKLAYLDVGDSQVTAEGIAWVKKNWPQIQVGSTDFASSPNEIALLRQFGDINARFGASKAGNVVIAHLFGTEMTDDSLLRLASLPNLEMVYLYDTSVTARGVKRLRDQNQKIVVRPNLQGPTSVEIPIADKLAAAGFKYELSDEGFIERATSDAPEMPDAVFALLAELPHLSTVGAASAGLTDDALAHLSNCTNLRALHLPNAEVTDAGLKHLASLTKLRSLELQGNGITDEGLSNLSGMKNLDNLTLKGMSLQADGLAHLQGCNKLARLDLTGSHIADSALANLPRTTAIRELILSGSSIVDSGLKPLQAWTALQHISVSDTELTDQGLLQLAPLTALRSVYYRDSKITVDGAAALRKALPNCRVSQ